MSSKFFNFTRRTNQASSINTNPTQMVMLSIGVGLYGTTNSTHYFLYIVPPFNQSSSRSSGRVYIKYTHYSRVEIKQQQLLPHHKVSLELDNIFTVAILFSSSIRLYKENWRKHFSTVDPCFK